MSSLDGRVCWTNHVAREFVGDAIGLDLAGNATGQSAAARRTLLLARGSSQRLHVRLTLGGLTELWHVWRVETMPGKPPFLLFEAEAKHDMVTKFNALQRHFETTDSSLEQEVEAARRLREEAAHLLRMVDTDRLTGILNGPGFKSRTKRILSGASSTGVFVFADLDGFKQINDEHGHDAGDAVLRELAARYSRETRSQDSVARIGGDEFAFWFDGATRATSAKTIRRLEEVTSEPIRWRDILTEETVELRVGVSFGQAFAPIDGSSFETLKAVSDKRMYASKRQKKGGMTRD